MCDFDPCPEHPRRIEIKHGRVFLNGERIGSVHPGSRINDRLTWRAWDVDGNQVPERGNHVRATEQAAAEMLAKAVTS